MRRISLLVAIINLATLALAVDLRASSLNDPPQTGEKTITDRVHETYRLMVSTLRSPTLPPEELHKSSKTFSRMLRDSEFAVRNQAAYGVLRCSQGFRERFASAELEKSLIQMISNELNSKGPSLAPEVTTEKGVTYTGVAGGCTVIRNSATKDAQGRPFSLFMMPCLYAGIQALGELHASSSESFDLLKDLLQRDDKNVRSAAAHAIATLKRPREELLGLLQDRKRVERDEEVTSYIDESIGWLVSQTR